MNLQTKVANLPIVDPIKNFAKLERILAAVLVLTPGLLILVDDGPDTIRGSISAYHDVAVPQAYYYPLTVAAMLFIVNGVLKTRDAHGVLTNGHWYNWMLGALLSVVVVFDHDGATKWPHYLGAYGFFGGSVAVMIWFSKNKNLALKVALVGTIGVSVVLWIATDWFTTFWAEWISLAIVATHYILDSVGWTTYTALKDTDEAKLIPTRQATQAIAV
jgi:hypothetical protein